MSNLISKSELERIEFLRKEIARHNELYYTLDAPEISDSEWDALYYELVDLETKYPESITSDSPTQKVGGENLNRFPIYTHTRKLLSLDKVSYDKEKLREWVVNVYKECLSLGIETEFVLERKIDGLTTIHNYNHNELELSATRGNGVAGEIVTSNTRTIKSIPKKVHFNGAFSVHGECYMLKSIFEKINAQRELEEKKKFANTRNLAAGSLRQLDSSICESRELSYFAYQINDIEGAEFETHSQTLEFLKEQGFDVPDYKVYSFNDLENLINDCVNFEQFRDALPYDIDGMVIKVNNLKCRDLLGATSKFPKWAIAYKFPPEIKPTVVEDICLQVGRTGSINFVASLRPIQLSGTSVSSATLYNIDFIREKDIRIGDTVLVQKGGEIIPAILSVVMEERKDDSIPYNPPTCCPECGMELIYSSKEVTIRCENPNCKPQLINRISHFASKNAMDINFLAEKISEQLINNGLIHNVSDLYYLRKEDLLTLDKFKDKKADNLLSSIANSKTKGLASLLFGLGIRNVGKENAILIAENFGSIDNIINAREEDIYTIPQIGEVIAFNIVEFFKRPEILLLIQRLRDAGIVMVQNKAEITSDVLDRKSVV